MGSLCLLLFYGKWNCHKMCTQWMMLPRKYKFLLMFVHFLTNISKCTCLKNNWYFWVIFHSLCHSLHSLLAYIHALKYMHFAHSLDNRPRKILKVSKRNTQYIKATINYQNIYNTALHTICTKNSIRITQPQAITAYLSAAFLWVGLWVWIILSYPRCS